MHIPWGHGTSFCLIKMLGTRSRDQQKSREGDRQLPMCARGCPEGFILLYSTQSTHQSLLLPETWKSQEVWQAILQDYKDCTQYGLQLKEKKLSTSRWGFLGWLSRTMCLGSKIKQSRREIFFPQNKAPGRRRPLRLHSGKEVFPSFLHGN